MFSYEENEKIVNKVIRKCICESLDDANETDITWWIRTTVNKWSGLRSIKKDFSIAIPQMEGVSDAIFVNALRAAFMEYVKVCNCNDDEDELSWMKGISKNGFMDYRNGGFFPMVGIIALLTAQKLKISSLPDISGFYDISTRDKTEKMAWKWFDKNYLNSIEKIDRGL